MQLKRDALVLRAVNYGESDKIITLLTPEGKISAGMRGVRKAGAKLRFAAQPFCFAEYVLAERGGRYTVTGATLHDGFFSVGEDIHAYYAGAVVLEACEKLAYEELESGRLLLSALNALKELAFLRTAERAPETAVRVLNEFLVSALGYAGYAVREFPKESADGKTLRMLGEYFERKIETPLRTLGEFLRLRP